MLTLLGMACGLILLLAVPAHAQLNGSHSLGDFGVQSGSQPQPGFYAALFYLRYDTDTIKDANGKTIRLSQDAPGSVAISAAAPILWYVSKTKFLGANYGALLVLPWANASIEAPAFAIGDTVSTSFADLAIRPLDLGWHAKRADMAAGFQFYAPTGRYERGGSDNIGKGMWTYEPFVGTTVYFDEKRTVSLATTAFWELHGKKKDTDVKVGQILTLEGGLGKSYLGGGLILGAAYYAQWKLSEDQLADFVAAGRSRARRRFSRQAQGVGLRAGRDAAGRQQVEALCTRQHPLPLGNRRAPQDTGADAGRHRDLPRPERQAQMMCNARRQCAVAPVRLSDRAVSTLSSSRHPPSARGLRLLENNAVPNATRLEWIGKYAAILSALVAATVGIGQYRRGVSQSIRELEWKQADMARTLINGLMNDEGWQAMTMLDWEEGRDYEVAPGTDVRILRRDVPVAIEASLRANGPQRTETQRFITDRYDRFLFRGESAAVGGTLGLGTKGGCPVSARVVR